MRPLEITWEVEDGYVCGSRPHKTIIDVEKDIMSEEDWNALTEDEKKQIIEEEVDHDYQQQIYFYITDYGF